MASMSSRDLRNPAVRATRIDKLFVNSDVVYPVKVQSIPCNLNATRLDITPGGEWLLIMDDVGTYTLHKTREFASTPLTVADPHVTSSPLCVLLSTSRHVGGELLVLVSEQYLSIE